MELTFISILIILSFWMAMKTSVDKFGSIIPPRSFKLYSVANNEGTKSEIVLSVLATNLGGAITIGLIGLVYKGGVVFYIAGLSYIIGLVLLYVSIPKIRQVAIKNNYSSFEEYLSHQNTYLNILVSIINIFTFIGLLISQIISLKLILILRFSSYGEYLLPLILFLVTIYTAFYGLRGIMENDKIQLIMISFWISAVIYVLFSNYSDLSNIGNLDINMLNGLKMGVPFLIVVVIFLPWTVLTRADYWQRIVAAKTDDIAKSAFGILIFIMFFIYALFLICGLYLVANYPNLDYNKAPFEILHLLQSGFFINVAVVGIVAALISSADSFLNISSVSVISLFVNIRKTIYSNKTNDENLGFDYRIITFVLGVISYFLVIMYNDLGSWIIMATTAVGVLVPTFLANLIDNDSYTNKPKMKSSILSILFAIIAYILSLVLKITTPNKVFIISIIVATLTYILSFLIFKNLRSTNEN